MKVSEFRLKLESLINVLSINDIQNDESTEFSVFDTATMFQELIEDETSAEIVTFCECGSRLHYSKIRGNIDTIDRDFICRKCGNRYNEYRLKYPSEHTAYNYEFDGVFTKI